MSEVRYTNSGDTGIIHTPNGDWGFRADKRLSDPDGHLLMRDIDVEYDQTQLQAEIDTINNTLAAHANSIQSDENRLAGHDNVLASQQKDIDTRIKGNYGITDGEQTGYALLWDGALAVCFKDSNGQDVWKHFRDADTTDNSFNQKVNKDGDTMTGTLVAPSLWTSSMHSDSDQTNFYFANRRLALQNDGNVVYYGTDGVNKFSTLDGTVHLSGALNADQTVRGKDMFILLTSSGSSSNELDMHMDADGIVRFYSQNGVSNGFHQFLAFQPANGNLDLYAPGGLFFNGQQVFSPYHMGSGSGLDADLLDGIDSTGFVQTNSTSTMNTDLIMNNHAFYTKGGGARLQLETNNHISVWNSNGQVVAWFDADGANQSLHVNDLVTANHFYNGSLDSYTDHTDIYYASRRTSFQTDGNTVWYGTDGAAKTTVLDGNIWTHGTISAEDHVNATGMLHVRSAGGSTDKNFLDMHMDDDGIVRFYSQNGSSNGFHQFLAFNPNGNLDLYAPVGLFFNGQQVFSPSHMGSGSGLDADLLDGIDSSGYVHTSSPSTMSTDLFMNGWAIYNQSGYGKGNARIQFGTDNIIRFINDSGNVAAWADTSGDNKSLHVNDIVTANHFYNGSLDSYTDHTDIYYASRRTSFQTDGNTVWYGTDGSAATAIQDGHIWTLGHVWANQEITSSGNIKATDMFKLTSSQGSNLNELDTHMDADGVWRVYVQNGMTNGFKQPINYVPTGNFDLYGSGGLFYNGHLLWHNGNQGSGSGLDADLLDGRDSTDFASASDRNNLQNQINNINTNVSNLSDQKVNKDGDTMTGTLVAPSLWTSSMHSDSDQTNFYFANRRLALQNDGNLVYYGTDGAAKTTTQDGVLWSSGTINSDNNVNATGMLHVKSFGGSNLNSLDMHMDDDGIVRFYSQNGSSNGFHQFLAFNPNGNLDLYSPSGLCFNGQQVFSPSHMGSGSGLDADLLDGIDSTGFVQTNSTSTMNTDLIMNNHAFYTKGGGARLQFETNNHITFMNSNGQVVAWFDADGANQSLHVNDLVTAGHFYNGSLDSYTDHTDIYYASRRTSFQTDGNTVWYGTDGAAKTTILDGVLFTNGLISTNTWVKCKDMFVMNSTSGSSLNEMDMHMDSDGVWRVYVRNALTNNAFKQPINYVPQGNFDLYGSGSLYYNSNLIWHHGNQGSGSGLDADLLDGRDSTDFASASDRNNLQNQIDNINTTVAANSGSSRLQSWGVDGGVATRVDDKVTLYLYYSTTANRITYPVTFKQVLSIQQSVMMYDGNVTAAYIESYDSTSVKVSAWARWGGQTHGVDTAFFLTVVGTV